MALSKKTKDKRSTQKKRKDRDDGEHGHELLKTEPWRGSYMERRVQHSQGSIITNIFLLMLSFIAFLMEFEIASFKKFLRNLNEMIGSSLRGSRQDHRTKVGVAKVL